MALRKDASTDEILFDTAAPTGDITVMAWVRIAVDNNNFSTFYYLGGDVDNLTQAIYLGTGADGTTLELWALTTIAARGTGTNLTAGTWYHLALVTNTGVASAFTVYLNGVSDFTGTLGDGTFSAQRVQLLDDPVDEWTNGNITALKIFNAQLTQDEVLNEMRYISPIRLANLWQWCPFLDATDNEDYSGNGRDYVFTTIATEDGPFIGWAPRHPHIGYWIAAAAAAFDAALMAAMSRPWRDIVFHQPKVVESGMKPPNLINP